METAYQRGWSVLSNGALLSAAEEASFDLLLTTDQSLRHQQDLSNRKLAILVLPTTAWPRIQERATDIAAAFTSMQPGEYRELQW